MKDAAEKYRKGLMSLAEAATMAHVNLYEMMDYLQRERICAPHPSAVEIEKANASAHELLRDLL